jgi:hypothetical protein
MGKKSRQKARGRDEEKKQAAAAPSREAAATEEREESVSSEKKKQKEVLLHEQRQKQPLEERGEGGEGAGASSSSLLQGELLGIQRQLQRVEEAEASALQEEASRLREAAVVSLDTWKVAAGSAKLSEEAILQGPSMPKAVDDLMSLIGTEAEAKDMTSLLSPAESYILANCDPGKMLEEIELKKPELLEDYLVDDAAARKLSVLILTGGTTATISVGMQIHGIEFNAAYEAALQVNSLGAATIRDTEAASTAAEAAKAATRAAKAAKETAQAAAKTVDNANDDNNEDIHPSSSNTGDEATTTSMADLLRLRKAIKKMYDRIIEDIKLDVDRDFSTDKNLIMAAARAGDTKAMFALSLISEEKDLDENALRGYEKTTAAGYPTAKTMLGMLYMGASKRVVKVNDTRRGLEYLLDAAADGCHRAQFIIGRRVNTFHVSYVVKCSALAKTFD